MPRTLQFDHDRRVATIDETSEVDPESFDFVVCAYATESRLPDNVHTNCAGCSKSIVHRPDAPLTPPKICIECVIGFAGSQH